MSLFIKDASFVYPGGDSPLLRDTSLLLEDSQITAIGPAARLAPRAAAARLIDGRGLLVLPGLINTHHHFYQTLTRNFPNVQDAELFQWLLNLYGLWATITPQDFHQATLVAALELLESGCTTAVDHSYMVPSGHSEIYHQQVRAAREAGLRLHLCRGSMSRSKKDGGLPPDSVVQTEDVIMAETKRLVDEVHEPQRGGMVRVIVAPCSPFSVTQELMVEAKKYAKRKGLKTHTHLAETRDEETYCLREYGCRPFEMMEKLGWMDKDSFFAHCVHLSPDEVKRMGRARGGIAHCPTSNMRLGSGIAPIVEADAAGVPIGLAVDGSASNDCSNMLFEVRNCLMLQRVTKGAGCLSARDALRFATLGGAQLLGRDDIGHLAPGMEADLIGIRTDTLRMAGSATDPLAAAVFCGADRVDLSVVHGELLIHRGKFTRYSEDEVGELIAAHNARSVAIYGTLQKKVGTKAGGKRPAKPTAARRRR